MSKQRVGDRDRGRSGPSPAEKGSSRRLRRLSVEPLEDRRLLSSSPVSFAAVDPPGSLIYQSPPIACQIDSPGGSVSFDIELSQGQTVSLAADPNAALVPTVALFDPSQQPVAGAVAGSPGESVVLQTVTATATGTYTLIVGGQGDTTGEATLQVILDAALEAESHGGPANDTLASAEDLDASFIALAGGLMQRGAVLGKITAPQLPVDSEDFESAALGGQWTTYRSNAAGRIDVTGDWGTAAGAYALVMHVDSNLTNNLNEAIWSVDLSGLADARLSFSHTQWADELHSFVGDFTGHVNADGVAISADGVRWHPVWNATNQANGVWNPYTIDLAAEAKSANMQLGPDFRIKFQQYDNTRMPTDGRGYDQIAITTTAVPLDDWYRFDLADGQASTVTLSGLAGDGAMLELYGAAGLIAAGVAGENASRSISNFVDATSDGLPETYFVRVGGRPGDYRLLATRGGDFDTEPNDPFPPDTQDIGPSGTVLGHVEPTIDFGPPATFAVLGDYGSGTINETYVADMIQLWQPDFVVTTGDNNYGSLEVGNAAWLKDIGQHFGNFILRRSDGLYPELTSDVQRFFPSVGNHDSASGTGDNAGNGGDLTGYLDYLNDDPAGGRLPAGVHDAQNSYYDFRWGPIHFFAVDSDHAVVSAASRNAQKAWLEAGLANSTAPWKFVFFHHAPYSSSSMHGDTSLMQWPFAEWGADAVFSGHDHVYERLQVDGLPYFISGLGGGSIYSFGTPVPGSIARYKAYHGSMRVSVSGSSATMEFLSVDDGAHGANGGRVIDALTIEKPTDFEDCYDVPVRSGDVVTIETFTPAAGPAGAANLLEPRLELFDPAGEPVADNDHGAADGRNALLTYTATASGTFRVRVTALGDAAGEYVLNVHGFTGQPDAAVVGRHVFYDNSRFDGESPGAGVSDDDALAPDKTALLPGQTATFANYTSYSRGINGIMVDIAGLADAAGLSASEDFRFRVGNGNDPADWAIAPPPREIAVRPLTGTPGDYRVSLLWDDHRIEGQWLQITVLATATTGLAAPDVFYFGNAVGEAGDRMGLALVNATDEIMARNFPHGALDMAAIDDRYDYDRDGLVNGTDQIIARNHQTNPLSMLRQITAPPGDASPQLALTAGSPNVANSPDSTASPDAVALAEWLPWPFDQESAAVQRRTSAKSRPAAAMVDKLIASLYWA